jgi:hypothetical protein
MDYSAMITVWSKMCRDLYKQTTDTIVEQWIKAEQQASEANKWFKK